MQSTVFDYSLSGEGRQYRCDMTTSTGGEGSVAAVSELHLEMIGQLIVATACMIAPDGCRTCTARAPTRVCVCVCVLKCHSPGGIGPNNRFGYDLLIDADLLQHAPRLLSYTCAAH